MQIKRVRMADGVAVSLDETYLPLALGRKVVENDLEVYPIFSLLEGKYDTPLLEADYRIEAILADPFVAEALGIEEGLPSSSSSGSRTRSTRARWITRSCSTGATR